MLCPGFMDARAFCVMIRDRSEEGLGKARIVRRESEFPREVGRRGEVVETGCVAMLDF